MRKLILTAALITFGTLFFLRTGLVYDEGGFGVQLTIKPEFSTKTSFGGGEHGQWARTHLGEPAPWWQSRKLPVLITGDWEQGIPIWVTAYEIGFIALLLVAWPLWMLAGLWWFSASIWKTWHEKYRA